MKKTRLAMVGVLALGLVACGNDKDFHGKSDAIQCVYNHNGALKHTLPAGSDTWKGKNDDQVFEITVADRFYNIDPNDSIRDAGAPKYVVGYSLGDKNVQMIVHVHFKINQSLACPNFVDQHMKRNIPEKVLKDSSITDKMGFNVRNVEDARKYTDQQAGESAEAFLARVPWAKFLNEKLGPAMQKVGAPLMKKYGKFALHFNYPTNADENGLLPCVNADEDNETCTERDAPAQSTYTAIEIAMGKALTAEVHAKMGGDYFCGVGYDATNPTECPAIDVEVVNISLVDTKPVTDRQALDTERDTVQNAQEAAQLEAAKQAAAFNQQQAQIEGNKKIRDLTDADAIAKAESDAAVLQAQQALAAEQSKQTATDKLAPCQSLPTGWTASDCSLLLAVLAGQPYPQGNNSTTINAG